MRDKMIDRIERVIRRFAPTLSIKLKCFGSFANNLHLPNADIDLVANSKRFDRDGRKIFCQSGNQMWRLSRSLEEAGLVKPGSLIVITRAKVPIIKFVEARTRTKVDISFENETGPKANNTIRDWMKDYPQARPLIAIVKQFLAMRDLNEVVNGGIGGFTIICLVVHMLQMTPQSPVPTQADLLLRFLDLYGNRFDIKTMGIIMAPPRYFHKGVDRVEAKCNPQGLSIIDPNRPDNDISGGSRAILQIFAAFKAAHADLQGLLEAAGKGQHVGRSLLLPLVGGNYKSVVERRRELLDLYIGLTEEVNSSYM